MLLQLTLGEKLFEESGGVTGFKVIKVHPIEGVTTEVSFTSEIRGIGRFPSGKNIGSGTVTQYRNNVSVFQRFFGNNSSSLADPACVSMRKWMYRIEFLWSWLFARVGLS